MNVLRYNRLAFSFAAFFVTAIAIMALPFPADAAVSSWQKGASVQSRGPGDFGSDAMKESLRNLKATGADTVAFVIPYYQENIHATDVWRGWNTPDDAALEAGIDYAHSIGLKAVFKIHLESYDGQWRAHINPWNKDMWFSSYGNVLMHYARMASAHGVEGMVIGTELITLSTNQENDQRWASLVGNIRSAYGGTLGYSANWGGDDFTEEVPDVRFWGALDYIGISAYYPLSWWGNNSVDAMRASWQNWNANKIKPVADRYGKPVRFTEIGYRSVNDSFTDPWNSWRGGSYDASAQTNAYTALFSYWNDHAFMQGGLLWDWSSDPNYGWEGNTDYTPQHKPAEAVIKDWFGRAGTTPPPPPPPSGPVSFTATGSAAPSTTSPGNAVSLAAAIANGANAASSIIVDMEIYDSGGTKIFQQAFENQSFASNEAKHFSASWTAGTNGSYTLKLGVFSAGWTANHAWNDSAATITVGGGTTPPPSPPPAGGEAGIDLWWPTDGSRISGVQPFKAMMPDRDISAYRMFWQVDGDRLNEMADSMEEYPHKESLVDLSGWNWKGAGPYALTFAAKDTGGSTIATRSVNIFTE